MPVAWLVDRSTAVRLLGELRTDRLAIEISAVTRVMTIRFSNRFLK